MIPGAVVELKTGPNLLLRAIWFLFVGWWLSDGVLRYERIATAQTSFLIRLAYFLLIGWWLSGLWMFGAWILCVSIIGFPLGLMMVNRVPFVITLHRGYA